MSWPTVSFSEVLKDVTGGNAKTLQSNYADVGQYPIIDQGQGMIGGYSDDRSCLCQTKPPVIIFGDHTKTLKFVDFPFCLGADGTKVLEAKDGADLKYLFYALHDIHIPEAGYSRHFKYLKAGRIPLPPLEEQKRIAGILDQADALRRLRTRTLEKLNTLGQAIFHEMFGDPAANPKGWPMTTLPEIGRLDRGVSKHRPRNEPALLNGNHPLIQTGDVARATDYITHYKSTYSDAGLAQSRMWSKGTVCITIAANIADTAILDFDACFPDSVVGFDSGEKTVNFFIHRWFATVKNSLEDLAPAVAQKNINLKILRELPVIMPPKEIITHFYAKECLLRGQKDKALLHLTSAETLFASLQHRAFRGEL